MVSNTLCETVCFDKFNFNSIATILNSILSHYQHLFIIEASTDSRSRLGLMNHEARTL